MRDGAMKSDLYLTSVNNPRVKQAMKLRDRRDRDQSQQFLIEGYREVFRAVHRGWPLESLFICPELFLGTNEHNLIAQITKERIPVISCSPQVFEKLSYRDRPDGLIAIGKQVHRDFTFCEALPSMKTNPFFVVAEAIEKPGNLGTILRSSDAVGVDALLLCDKCTDLFNPNVVRASVGTLFSVPVVECSSRSALEWLKKGGVSILAATPSAEQEFTQVDMRKPLAIAVGTEQLGLSKVWMEEADIQVRIPMCGMADSLNVAMATTLLLYEALRQRRLST